VKSSSVRKIAYTFLNIFTTSMSGTLLLCEGEEEWVGGGGGRDFAAV